MQELSSCSYPVGVIQLRLSSCSYPLRSSYPVAAILAQNTNTALLSTDFGYPVLYCGHPELY